MMFQIICLQENVCIVNLYEPNWKGIKKKLIHDCVVSEWKDSNFIFVIVQGNVFKLELE